MRTLQDLAARGWRDGAACVRARARSRVREDPMRVWGRAVEFRQVGVCGQLWRNLDFPCVVTAERAAQTPPRLLLGRCKGRRGEEKSPFYWVGPYKTGRSHKQTARIFGESNKFCSLIVGLLVLVGRGSVCEVTYKVKKNISLSPPNRILVQQQSMLRYPVLNSGFRDSLIAGIKGLDLTSCEGWADEKKQTVKICSKAKVIPNYFGGTFVQ